MKSRILLLIGVSLTVVVALFFYSRSNRVKADVDIFASPVHAGCYVAASHDCRIHVEPFTINLASGKKMVLFRLVSIEFPGGIQTVIYDWKPDQSNPAPPLGDTYSPSLVTQDFAATCGHTYEISLQGQDTGDSGIFNLGLTGQFTCPSAAP
jgi:hypothetical protein